MTPSIAVVLHLLKQLLLNSQLLVDVKCFNPLMRKKNASLEAIKRLSKTVLECLGHDATCEVFSLKKDVTLDHLVDIITLPCLPN